MEELILDGNDAIIVSDYCKTKKFQLNNPVSIKRVGLTESLKGVYKLVYILEEEKK